MLRLKIPKRKLKKKLIWANFARLINVFLFCVLINYVQFRQTNDRFSIYIRNLYLQNSVT
jgi:hypothetical protein